MRNDEVGRPAAGAAPTTGTVGPVREAHRFDEAALAHYLQRQRLAGAEDGIRVSQFEGGQSNPTFLLEGSEGRRWVLRKKPAGELLASAHMIDREYRIMSALTGTDVPVANARLYCDDSSVIGTPFFVMDHVDGRIFRDPALPELTPAERGAVYRSAVETLAKLHAVDWRAQGLEGYGKPTGYVSRQVARWSKQYELTKSRPIPAMEWLGEWLPKNAPPDGQATIVHGDFRLDNMVFHRTEPRVVALLDWELSTIGDPHSDVAYHCIAYHLPSEKRGLRGLLGRDLAALGIPTEAEVVATYCRARGLDAVPAFDFHLAFGLYRLAAIAQGIEARMAQGNASSDTAADIASQTETFAETAKRIAQRGESKALRSGEAEASDNERTGKVGGRGA